MKTKIVLISTLLILLSSFISSREHVKKRVYVQVYGICTTATTGTVEVIDEQGGPPYFSGNINALGYLEGTVESGAWVTVNVTSGGHYGQLCNVHITETSTYLYVCCEDVNCFVK